MCLIDANVISESRKCSKADSVVRAISKRVARTDVAQRYVTLRVSHPDNALEKQIAATALIYDLTVVTRNHKYFLKTGVRLLNPLEQ